jgi:predicted membrane-bound spermidine synthase
MPDGIGLQAARRAIAACFFVSGAAGLIYEVVWSRQLALFLGITTYANTAVITAYMIGLAAGSLLLGRVADRLRDPQRLAWAGTVAIVGNAIVTALTKMVLVMAYPMPLGFEIPFPLHEMSRLVVGGRFFQRIEGIWLYLWVMTTGCFLAALLHVAAKAFSEAFGLPQTRLAVLPMVSAALTIAFFPPDQGRTLTWHGLGTPWGGVITFGLPGVLALVAAMRRRRASSEA